MNLPMPWPSTHLHRTTKSVERVLDDSLGIYSTQPTGHLELAARVSGYQLDDLTRVVEEDRTAVRLSTLRGSGFVIPTHLVPVVHAASIRRRVRSFAGPLARNLTTDYESWANRIEAVLAGEMMAPQEIKERLGPLGDDAGLMRFVIRTMANECRIVAARVTGSWRSDRTLFTLWSEWLSGVDVHSLGEVEAREQLARLYLDRHGPATIADFSFWSGVPKGQSRKAIESVAEPVSGGNYWATHEFEAHPPPPVRLLPIWDTLFVTYRDRSRFVRPAHYPLVYDKDGNATLVVLVEGWAAGVWNLGKDDDHLEIKAAPFDEFSRQVWDGIEEEAHRIGRLIGSASVTIMRGEGPTDLTTQPRNRFMNPLRFQKK